jgi:hypothetical protein
MAIYVWIKAMWCTLLGIYGGVRLAFEPCAYYHHLCPESPSDGLYIVKLVGMDFSERILVLWEAEIHFDIAKIFTNDNLSNLAAKSVQN